MADIGNISGVVTVRGVAQGGWMGTALPLLSV